MLSQRTTARDIALHFGTFEKVWTASDESFDSIQNIGPAVLASFNEFRHSVAGKKIIEKFREVGVKPKAVKKIEQGIFSGKTIVLTGTLSTLSRDEAKKIILSLGGKVASSVSKNTNFVLVGENPGSKYDEAQQLGVEIIHEKNFLKITKGLL